MKKLLTSTLLSALVLCLMPGYAQAMEKEHEEDKPNTTIQPSVLPLELQKKLRTWKNLILG